MALPHARGVLLGLELVPMDWSAQESNWWTSRKTERMKSGHCGE